MTARVVTAGVRVATTAPDVVGLVVSGPGRGRGCEVVVSGVSGVENTMERTGPLMGDVVVVICVEVSRGGVE